MTGPPVYKRPVLRAYLGRAFGSGSVTALAATWTAATDHPSAAMWWVSQ